MGIVFYGDLYWEIKRKLYSGRKDEPATRVEVRVKSACI